MKLAASLTATLFLLLTGCGGSSGGSNTNNSVVPAEVTDEPTQPGPIQPDGPVPPTPIQPTGLITDVRAGSSVGQFFAGSAPAAVGSVSISPLTANNEVIEIISGGSLQIPVNANVPFSRIYVNSDSEGFFSVDMAENSSNADLVATYSTVQLDGTDAEINVQVETSEGAVSAPRTLRVTTLVVGTGEVQVSISWDQPTDVDLFLLEPGDDPELIYYGDNASDDGGMLDLDSNPACAIDGVNNENITYQGADAPSGEYIVAVSYYSNCDISVPTNFVVTVRANGSTETFTGRLFPVDVSEDIADARVITTFTIP